MRWGGIQKLIILFFAIITIEIMRQRLIYLIHFSSIIGFSVAGIAGTVVGLIVGIGSTLFYKFKLHEDNVSKRYWNDLWQ